MDKYDVVDFIRNNLKIRVNTIDSINERFEVSLYMYVDGEVEEIDSDSIRLCDLRESFR